MSKTYSVIKEFATVEGFWMPHDKWHTEFVGSADSRDEAEAIAESMRGDGSTYYVHENEGRVSRMVSVFNDYREVRL